MSALISVLPLWYIWKILSCILFDEGEEYIYTYAWYAVIFTVVSILVYIAELLYSRLAEFRKYSAMLSSLAVAILLFWSDWKLALVCLAPIVLSFVIMAMTIRTSGYTRELKGPMICCTVSLNSTFLFLIAYGIGIARSGVSQEFMKSFLLAVIAAPSISADMTPSARLSENRNTSRTSHSDFNLALGSLACTLQNLTLIFPFGLIYSFLIYMFLLYGTANSIQNQSAVFYLSTGFVCAFLILFSSWFKYTTFTELSDRRHTASLTGAIISTVIIAVSLIFIDWRMALSALWVLIASLAISALKSKNVIITALPYMILKLGIISVALTGAFLYADKSLSFNTFILFILITLRLYDPFKELIHNER